MTQTFDFVQGEQYTNRKGTYTVLSVNAQSLVVRYEDGTEETLDRAIQARILSNMTLPPRTPEPPSRAVRARAAAKVAAAKLAAKEAKTAAKEAAAAAAQD
jgi:hypothetical protein